LYSDDQIMKKLLLLSLILITTCTSNNLFAQCGNLPPQINFTNGSFEDTPKSPSAPSGWETLMNPGGTTYNITPDVQPLPNHGPNDECAMKNPANHGKTYVSMMKCGSSATDGPQEYISQKLTAPLQSGITYKSTFDLMGPKNYWLRGDVDPRTNSYCIGIQIWAGFTSGAKTQLLYTSVGATVNDTWSTIPYTITPNNNYTYFSIYAVNPAACASNGGCAFLAIDNFTDLKPTSIDASAKDITCFNAKNGTAEVTKPTGNTFTYTWSQVGGSYTGQGQTITNLPPGKYAVIVKSGSTVIGCDTVEVMQPEEIILTPTQTDLKCFGDKDGTASVNVKGGKPVYTYAWTPNTTDKTANAANLAAGTYTCTVTDSGKCEKQQVFTIKAPDKLTATATATNVTVPKGSDGTATATAAGGTAAYKYSWSTTPAQTTKVATNLKAGTYTCTITDANNCTTQVNVTITQPAVIKIKVDTVHVTCYGESNGKITLTITEGTPAFVYKWSTPNGVNETASNLAAGVYKCVVTDADGAIDSVSVTIKEPDFLVVSATAKNIACSGSSTGEAAATAQGGVAPYKYEWSTQPVQTTAAVTNLAAGTYTCVVTDNNNCTASTTVVITEPPPLTGNVKTTNVTCNGFTDGKVVVTALGGTPPYQYMMGKNPFQTDSVFNNLAAGNYTCIAKDANNCVAMWSFTITEPALATISAQRTDVTCNTGTDGSATVMVSGATNTTYYWLPNGATTAKITGLKAGSYDCYITYNAGCKANMNVTITEPQPVSLLPIPGQTICVGQSTTLTAVAFGGNAGTYTYDWNNGAHTAASYTVTPALTATYTVIAADSKGCKSPPVTATVKVGEKLVLQKLVPAIICAGQSAKLIAKASGGSGAPYIYSWLPQGTGTGDTVVVTPASTEVYTLTVKDNCGTPPVKDSVTVTVVPKPVIDFVADTLSGCAPLCITFTANVKMTGDVISQYIWDFGDNAGIHKSKEIHSNCFNKEGIFNVSLSIVSANGCSGSVTKTNYITTTPAPVADFTSDPNTTTISEPVVNFKDASTTDVTTWSWNFGDKDPNGNTSAVKSPYHQYNDTGNYCITLTVKTANKCENKTVHCVRVAPDVKFYIPNAFTPNSDLRNQEFYPVGSYVKAYEMWIYDRWGMLLFHSDNINNHWNGSVNNTGEQVPIDSYVYKIQISDTESKKHEFVGTVSVIR
jgi:gliding motility-associated-like protein